MGMDRRDLPPDAEVGPLPWAASAVGISENAMRKRLVESGSVRGLPPRSPRNPSGRWLVSVEDVQALCEEKGRPLPPAPPAWERTVAAIDEDLRTGYELAREAEKVAKEDRDRAINAALRKENDMLAQQLIEARAEIERLRGAVRSLVATSTPSSG